MPVNQQNTWWSDKQMFEATQRGAEVSFDIVPDGRCTVRVDVGRVCEQVTMTPEQFTAFKEWVKKQ